MGKLNVNTPRGQEATAHEVEAIELFEKLCPKLKFYHTPKDKPASLDGILCKGQDIKFIVESKCRFNMTRETLARWDNEWLLTKSKVEIAGKVADSFSVPLMGWLYLVEDKALMMTPLWFNGKFACDYRV